MRCHQPSKNLLGSEEREIPKYRKQDMRKGVKEEDLGCSRHCQQRIVLWVVTEEMLLRIIVDWTWGHRSTIISCWGWGWSGGARLGTRRRQGAVGSQRLMRPRRLYMFLWQFLALYNAFWLLLLLLSSISFPPCHPFDLQAPSSPLKTWSCYVTQVSFLFLLWSDLPASVLISPPLHN